MTDFRNRGWRRRWSFMAATTGATIGLGNLWKFSYLAGENGGSAFVLAYIACVFLVATPILIAEIVMGSRGRANPIAVVRDLSLEAGVSRGWQLLGWMGVIAGILILSYYSVIAGWAFAYVEKMLSGEFNAASTQLAGDQFVGFLASPLELTKWQTLFLACVLGVISLGVRYGIGAAGRLLVPLVFLALIALVLYSLQVGDADAAIEFMFNPDWSQLTPKALLLALGHAFFSLSIGVGAMMVFGAYTPDRRSITAMVSTVAVFDTLVSLMAGLAIFPLVFSLNTAPSMGPGLMFVALPYGFGNMVYGAYFGALFFVMVSMVALTSGVALIEPAVAWLSERLRWRRVFAVLASGFVVWLLGLVTVLSFNEWQGVRVAGMSLFSLLDFAASNILLPLGGLGIAVFVGWRMRPEVLRDELYVENRAVFFLWYRLLRYIAAPCVLVIVLSALVDMWA